MPQPQDRATAGHAQGSSGHAPGGIRIAGELLVTVGVVLSLFLGWQLWGTNVTSAATQQQAVRDFVRQYHGGSGSDTSGAPADLAAPPSGAPADPAAPPAGAGAHPGPGRIAEPSTGATLGILYVPRFGADYSRPIVQGTGPAVLDTLGIGHYEGTAMPGVPGNFAVAGHRQTRGAVLDSIDALVPGDRIYVQTLDGFYTYVFRSSEIVLPDRTDVLLPVPARPGAIPTESYLTMTSCHPRFGSQERFVAYARLEQWQPGSAGPPAEIASLVERTMREE